jgi:acyl-CoA thioester hydrolase
METRVRVRYAETDKMGVVYYANYLIWMEVGRADYCRALGFRYRDMEETDGILLAVAEANCRYIWPARYDEEVTIRTWIGAASDRIVEFQCEMWTDRLLASGYTKHLFVDRELRRARLPAKYYELFGIPTRAKTPLQTTP